MQRDELRSLIDEMYASAHPLTKSLCKAVYEVWSRAETKHKQLKAAIELGRKIGSLAEKMAAAMAADETPVGDAN